MGGQSLETRQMGKGHRGHLGTALLEGRTQSCWDFCFLSGRPRSLDFYVKFPDF